MSQTYASHIWSMAVRARGLVHYYLSYGTMFYALSNIKLLYFSDLTITWFLLRNLTLCCQFYAGHHWENAVCTYIH